DRRKENGNAEELNPGTNQVNPLSKIFIRSSKF
ncbi:unnamed protein product, partial [marine sediment metagenome]